MSNSLTEIGKKYILINNPKEFKNIEKLIIPELGRTMMRLKIKKNFFYEIKKFSEKKPILGICGMQILSEKGFEDKKTKGLALISGVVDKIYEKQKESHVGWNNLKIIKKNSILFKKLKKSDFYFVHSYSFETKYKSDISSNIYFNDKKLVGSIEKEHIFGVQFHPEKS